MKADSRRSVRIQKILSAAGIASRRTAEELIARGRVTVNGRTATLGNRALPGTDEVAVDGVVVDPIAEPSYYALNKPVGVLSTVSDPQGRKTVLDLLDESDRSERLYPVGRLDMDSSGLILLTNDGFLANRLAHPRYEVPREYLVEVEPEPTSLGLSRLRKGIDLADCRTGPAKVSLRASQKGRGLVRFEIHTGRKRQIRRSFEAIGCSVVSLNRVRFGTLNLGTLKPGHFRKLEPAEVADLYRATGWEYRT